MVVVVVVVVVLERVLVVEDGMLSACLLFFDASAHHLLEAGYGQRHHFSRDVSLRLFVHSIRDRLVIFVVVVLDSCQYYTLSSYPPLLILLIFIFIFKTCTT